MMKSYFIPLVIEGNVNLTKEQVIHHYKQSAPEGQNKDAFAKKAIFVFPGNKGHHTSTDLNQQLNLKKAGAGLANLAGALGDDSYLTLSLPTTGMEKYDPRINDKTHQTVHGAMEVLKEAVKEGYHIVLPVRPHDKNLTTAYFSSPVIELDGKGYEPCFWGGIQKQKNLPLAEYYTKELKELIKNGMMQLSPKAKTAVETQRPSYTAQNPARLFKPVPQAAPHLATEKGLDNGRGKLENNMAEKIRPLQSSQFIVAKGNLQNTFKVGFKDAEAAQRFVGHLKEQYKNYNVTYYGGNEKYPMDDKGEVRQDGGYKHIVRFEVDKEALQYLMEANVDNAETLFNGLMGTLRPSLGRN